MIKLQQGNLAIAKITTGQMLIDLDVNFRGQVLLVK
jgi:hypothetical protein